LKYKCEYTPFSQGSPPPPSPQITALFPSGLQSGQKVPKGAGEKRIWLKNSWSYFDQILLKVAEKRRKKISYRSSVFFNNDEQSETKNNLIFIS
jgi:hypothetical protein